MRTDDGELGPSKTNANVGQSSGIEVLARLGTDQPALAEFCRRNGIRRLAVFGSALRDDLTPDSDIDLLVEFEPGQVPGMLRISGMELELEENVLDGRRVDLRTAAELGPRSTGDLSANEQPATRAQTQAVTGALNRRRRPG